MHIMQSYRLLLIVIALFITVSGHEHERNLSPGLQRVHAGGGRGGAQIHQGAHRKPHLHPVLDAVLPEGALVIPLVKAKEIPYIDEREKLGKILEEEKLETGFTCILFYLAICKFLSCDDILY